MGSVRYRRDRNLVYVDYVDATGRRMREKIGLGRKE